VIDPVIMFNEVAVLDGKENPVSAIAAQKATLWYTSCNNFQILLTRIPEVSLGLLKVLARRNRLLLSHFEDLSTRSILERTAKLLLEISCNGNIVIQRGENPSRVMASRISTIPEAFSRALRYFKEQGYIDCTRTTISIKNPEKLAEISKIIFPLI
jgi:CRP/FNR family transcriptional regulator, cyclic AMP receptor protein